MKNKVADQCSFIRSSNNSFLMNFSLFYHLLDAIALTEMTNTLDKNFEQVYNSSG
jgi:hypothetical protein